MSSQPFEASASSAQAVVQITLGQVYNEVRQTHEAVQGLVSSLEPIKSTLADHEVRLRAVDALPADVKEVKDEFQGLEKRLGKVEWRQGMWAGGAAVFAGTAGSLITWALSRH